MISKKLRPYSCVLLAFVAFMAAGCGKKANEEDTSVERSQAPQVTDIEAQLNKQELFYPTVKCKNDDDCPTYIAKVAVLQKGELKFCTGFLTKDNVLVTASSCFPDHLRSRNAACDKEVTVFFANTLNEKPTRVSCEKILDISPVELTEQPYLWRSDVAYLKLNLDDSKIRKEINGRTKKTIARSGPSDMERYTWNVDQIDAHQGLIRKADNCLIVHNSFFNPQSTNNFSPVMTMAGCKFNSSNTGAPVMDYKNKVRGIVSSDVPHKEIEEANALRINELPLKEQMYASNFACAPIYQLSEMIQNESECQKVLSIEAHEAGKLNMQDEPKLFKTGIQNIESNLNEKNEYMVLAGKLEAATEGYDFQVEVKCFKNTNAWLPTISGSRNFETYAFIPKKNFKKKMNEFGKIYAKITGDEEVKTRFTFKPSLLRGSNAGAPVLMRPEPNGPTVTFPSVPKSCPPSLL